MKSLEDKLQAILFRSECPPNMELGEYELGILETPRRNEIASHLAACPHCQVDLHQIRQFMAISDVVVEAQAAQAEQVPLLERIKVVVVNLTSPSFGWQGAMSAQPVFRGAEENATRVVEADDYVISLTTVADKSTWPKQNMIGDILPLGDDEDFVNWSANLWRSGELLASTQLEADSHFIFEDVQFEERAHELILSGPTVEIHLQNLHIA